MPLAVYSANLFHGPIPPAFTELFTIPADKTGVLRDIELYSADPLEIGINIQVGLPGSTTIIYAVKMETGTWLQWRGDVVIPSGQGVWGYAGASTSVQICLSGYLLTNP